MKITVAGVEFPSKQACADHARHIYKESALSERLPVEADVFLRDLIRRHPEAESKIGVGIDHFTVEPNEYGARTFWLHRTDGTSTDFSFLQCIAPTTHKGDVIAAMRQAITDQILAFKSTSFSGRTEVPCAETGAPVQWNECHVDHYPARFSEIASGFLVGLDADSIQLADTRDGKIGVELADPQFRQSWCAHHAKHARYRIVTPAVNLARR